MSDGDSEYLGLVLAGWVLAFVLPPAGIVACVLLDKHRPGHALGIGMVSGVLLSAMYVGWLFLLD